jgi:serine/threonine-protein kinase RsbW
MAERWAVEVLATPAGLLEGRDALERFCADQRLHPRQCWPLHVAFDELVSNLMRHAASDAAVHVRLAFRRVDDTVQMEIEDDGPPFNPLAAAAPDVTAPLDDRMPGGLGIALVRCLMDRVEYRRGTRNVVILTKRVAARIPGG